MTHSSLSGLSSELLGNHDATDAAIASADRTGEYGQIFTRRWIVDLVLDLAGFTSDRDLAAKVSVEPSCGCGAFLVPMAERLVEACRRHGRDLREARTALRAFDVLPSNAEAARRAVEAALVGQGVDQDDAIATSREWVTCGDFLLSDQLSNGVDFVVGNPPYLRLEDVPATRSAAYRRRCPTMRGRSDVFIGFIETGLRLLRRDGVLAFIVADRWMHNQYGRDLRRLICEQFSVEAILSMHDVDAFEEAVSAYPAISVFRRAQQSRAILAETTATFNAPAAREFRRWIVSPRTRLRTATVKAAKIPSWFSAESSWPSGDPQSLALVGDLERRFPPLEQTTTGTRVGIGVASGCDDVYLTRDVSLVEKDRLLPLLMSRDTVKGNASWTGTYLVNPWRNGRLVDLDKFPRLRNYLESHSPRLRSRHVARKNPDRWYRTIDRVDPRLREQPKIIIPDLKAFFQPVLDRGHTYPHHGLYFVTSTSWDLEVLGGLLLSDIAELFIATYCVKMRGGCYRFQAQYLRRIRVPTPDSIGKREGAALRRAFRDRDRGAASEIARRLYGVRSRKYT